MKAGTSMHQHRRPPRIEIHGASSLRPARDRGLTTVEVIVASTTLLLITLAVMMVLHPIGRQNRLSREAALANAEAQRVLDRMQTLPFGTLTTLYPQDTKLSLPSLTDGTVTITYEDEAATPLVIGVNVSWTNADDGTIDRQFTTARTN